MAQPGNLVQNIISGVVAICVAAGGIYTIAMVPQNLRIEKVELGRETDRTRIDSVNVLIQTNDEYKKTVATEIKWLRSDLNLVIKRIDRIDQRTEEADRRSSPTIVDEMKNLRSELQDLRKRIMVPVTAAPQSN
jgi:hypothetical protein